MDLKALVFPDVLPERELVLAALAEVSASADALTRLKVGSSLQAAVAMNIELAGAPVAPAHQVYTGVLFQGLDYEGLSPQEQDWADQNVLVSSGLFGLVRLSDCIPAYRLSMDVNLGVHHGTKIGGLASFWKKHLTPRFADKAVAEVVVDCRSTSYVKSMATDPKVSVQVDVFNTVGGQLKKISHHAKHYRGIVANRLIKRAAAGAQVKDLKQLLGLVQEEFPDYQVELLLSGKRNTPTTLALILPEA